MSNEDFLKSDKSRIINEIIQTETNYVTDLQKLQTLYFEALSQTKFIPEKDLKFIFSSKSLIPINEILLDHLKKFWGKYF
jgi:hypothetical protein